MEFVSGGADGKMATAEMAIGGRRGNRWAGDKNMGLGGASWPWRLPQCYVYWDGSRQSMRPPATR